VRSSKPHDADVGCLPAGVSRVNRHRRDDVLIRINIAGNVTPT